MTGIIKFFNQTKGFGFIVPDNGDEELFVHISGCIGDFEPQEGDTVSYEIGEGRRGPQAVDVQLVGSADHGEESETMEEYEEETGTMEEENM